MKRTSASGDEVHEVQVLQEQAEFVEVAEEQAEFVEVLQEQAEFVEVLQEQAEFVEVLQEQAEDVEVAEEFVEVAEDGRQVLYENEVAVDEDAGVEIFVGAAVGGRTGNGMQKARGWHDSGDD